MDPEPLDHEAIRPVPQRAGRRRPLPDLLELRRGMRTVSVGMRTVSNELSKVVNYPAVDVQVTLRLVQEQLNRIEERQVIATTRDRNQTARFYNQMAAKRWDAISVMYSLVTDQENNLQVNMVIPDFPRMVNDLFEMDARTQRSILQALEFPNDALDDVGLKLAVRKVIGVGSGFEGLLG